MDKYDNGGLIGLGWNTFFPWQNRVKQKMQGF